LEDEVIKAVKGLINENLKNSIEKNKETIKKFADNQIHHMNKIGNSYKNNQEKFAYILGFKNTMFWIFAGSWFIWFAKFLWDFIIQFI
jgi:hypothetical protein